MSHVKHDVLAAAATDALRAPSIFNTQPWAWHLAGEALELRADRNRQLNIIDPEGQLMLLSCGIALHHAELSLACRGYRADVRRLVSSFDDELLARITLGTPHVASARERAMNRATWTRRTDRRPFEDGPVSPAILRELADEVSRFGMRMHQVRDDQLSVLAIAAAVAGSDQLSDVGYRSELVRWVNRPGWSADGVPAGTAVMQAPRRVPLRAFTMAPTEGVPVEPGGDLGASYAVVYGERDSAADWFAAGEAVSALMLTATTLGLAFAPMSDVVEVARPRQLVTQLLPTPGYPYLVLRLGWPRPGPAPGHSPRREASDAIAGLIDT